MRSKNMATLATILACQALISGCSKVDLGWTEEVEVGRIGVVTVSRTAHGKKREPLGGPHGWEKNELTLAVSAGNADVVHPPEWKGRLTPILIDYSNDTRSWIVLSSLSECRDWSSRGHPIPPYIQYVSVNGGPWREVPLEARLVGRKANLLTNIDYERTPNTVDKNYREERNTRSLRIDQEVLRSWGLNENNFCATN